MGTGYQIQYFNGVDEDTLEPLVEAYFQNFSAIFSTWKNDTEISRLNQAPINQWLVMSASLSIVMNAVQKVHQQSQGYFDITMGNALKTWGFYGQDLSTQANNSLKKNGAIFLKIEKHSLKKTADILLDLSAIAKGHALDGLAILLQQYGIKNFLIEVGGEVLAQGTKQGKPWRVGVAKTQLTYDLNNMSIATSGNYYNLVKKNKQQYGHIFNPKTQTPTQSDFLSVSVVHQSTMLADAYATTIMAMPTKIAKQFIKAQALKVILVYDNPQKHIEKINL